MSYVDKRKLEQELYQGQLGQATQAILQAKEDLPGELKSLVNEFEQVFDKDPKPEHSTSTIIQNLFEPNPESKDNKDDDDIKLAEQQRNLELVDTEEESEEEEQQIIAEEEKECADQIAQEPQDQQNPNIQEAFDAQSDTEPNNSLPKPEPEPNINPKSQEATQDSSLDPKTVIAPNWATTATTLQLELKTNDQNKNNENEDENSSNTKIPTCTPCA